MLAFSRPGNFAYFKRASVRVPSHGLQGVWLSICRMISHNLSKRRITSPGRCYGLQATGFQQHTDGDILQEVLFYPSWIWSHAENEPEWNEHPKRLLLPGSFCFLTVKRPALNHCCVSSRALTRCQDDYNGVPDLEPTLALRPVLGLNRRVRAESAPPAILYR